MTKMLIGRWQPLHDGHKKLIQAAIDSEEHVIILIRDIPLSKDDPYSVGARTQMLRKAFGPTITIIPIHEDGNGLELLHGRKVGWSVKEVRLDEETEKISGTEIRKEIDW